MLKRVVIGSGLIVSGFVSSMIMAKDITLYDQPTDTAKVIGKINSEAGFVPIFTQKEGLWSKVGDPSNGNTGWVKSKDLTNVVSSPNGFSFSQSVVSDGKGASPMVVRFGKPTPMSDKQVQAYLWQSRQQQEAVQRDIQSMMQSFFNAQPGWMRYPMVLPVMVVPVQQTVTTQAAPAKPSSTGKSTP